jgi:two-component system KDP operon response regulator KdpE
MSSSHKNSSVLVVDDEESLRDFVRRNLEVRGYTVYTAGNGLEALAVFDSENVELVILDVMMPHMDGLETLRRIRQQSFVPIIVLSAMGEEQDKVRALNLGADDYLAKPFGVNELMARVRAVQRRERWLDTPSIDGQLVQGEIVVDQDRHEVFVRGERIDFTPTEFSLLAFLMKNAGKVLPHEIILRSVWGPEYGGESEYLRVYVGRLRQKVEVDPARPKYLITERGVGYCFERT